MRPEDPQRVGEVRVMVYERVRDAGDVRAVQLEHERADRIDEERPHDEVLPAAAQGGHDLHGGERSWRGHQAPKAVLVRDDHETHEDPVRREQPADRVLGARPPDEAADAYVDHRDQAQEGDHPVVDRVHGGPIEHGEHQRRDDQHQGHAPERPGDRSGDPAGSPAGDDVVHLALLCRRPDRARKRRGTTPRGREIR